MTRKAPSFVYLLGCIFLLFSCSKKDSNGNNEPPANQPVKTKSFTGDRFAYKTFYQEAQAANTRRGIIILAVGDGGTKDDPTLNGQCEALAKKGYVAITTTYRPSPGTYANWMASLKADFETIISQEGEAFNIPRSKVVIGGLSRGGNLTFGLVLPGQIPGIPPMEGIKGVILECAGGDDWKAKNILFPVLFMSNATDAEMGTDAAVFRDGLLQNGNPGVKTGSKTLIVSGQGHCTGSNQYAEFIANNIDSWF